MAKKSRRARRQKTARSASILSPTQAPQASPPSAAPRSDQTATVAPASGKLVDFSTEYRYVISDLRSMAMIAVAMLAVLIALSFVIR